MPRSTPSPSLWSYGPVETRAAPATLEWKEMGYARLFAVQQKKGKWYDFHPLPEAKY
jgi:hypothetical protein